MTRSPLFNAKTLVGLAITGALLAACTPPEPMLKTQQHAAPESSASVHARFVPERRDDFAFENDMVAFRKYGPDIRSGAENAGLDCWSKRVEYPIIDKWYKQHLDQDKSYHKDWGEGLDNYHVGSSAGCGSSALWINDEWQGLETFMTWQIIEQTPNSVSFALTYENEIDGDVYQETKHIRLNKGERLFSATSQFYKNGQVAADLPVAVGIATHDGKANVNHEVQAGFISGWEVLGDSGLGIGVLVDPRQSIRFETIGVEGEKDTGHALYVVNTDSQGKLRYYAGYGWQKAGVITSQDVWNEYLKDFATTTARFNL